VLVAAPHIINLAGVLRSPFYVVAWQNEPRITDLSNFLLPPDYHVVTGEWAAGFRRRFGVPGGHNAIACLGLAVPAGVGATLILLGRRRLGALLRLRRREWLFWSAVGAAGALLAPGDELTVLGHRLFPMPYALFRRLPVLENLRIPARFLLFTMTALAVLLSLGLSALAGRRANAARFLAGAVLLLVVWDGAWRTDIWIDLGRAPYRLNSRTVEALKGCDKARDPVILPVPVSFLDARPSFWQTQVGGRMVFAATARVPPASLDLIARHPILARMDQSLWLPWDEVCARSGSEARALEQLQAVVREVGVDALLIWADGWPGANRLAENFPGGCIVHRDGHFIVLDVRSLPPGKPADPTEEPSGLDSPPP